MRMCYQIHYIFFEVSTCTRNNMYFVLTNHFCQRHSQLGSGHCSSQRNQHFSSFEQMLFVPFCSIQQCSSIKMPIIVFDKLSNRSFTHFAFSFIYFSKINYFSLYPSIFSTSSEVCCSEKTSVAKIPFLSLSIKMCLGCGIRQW